MIAKVVLRVFILALIFNISSTVGYNQAKDRQVPVKVTAKPRKAVFESGEPILIDIDIHNGLKAEIIVQGAVTTPNAWNGETLAIQLPDIYLLPNIRQRYLKRPDVDFPKFVSAPGGLRVRPKDSVRKTIDVSKWTITDGWIPGKYHVLIRVDKIDVDKYTWINVHSDPVFFEIR